MSKRNGTITDAYDHEHRRRFVAKARGKKPVFVRRDAQFGISRQVARNLWAQRIRGANIGAFLVGVFDEVSAEMAGEEQAA